MMAALDPAGPIAGACGITWTLLCPTSTVAALVSAALSPFHHTARQALRLSRVGLWSGSIAFAVALFATVATASPTNPPEPLWEGLLIIVVTGIAPVLAFFTARINRRHIAELELIESARKNREVPV